MDIDGERGRWMMAVTSNAWYAKFRRYVCRTTIGDMSEMGRFDEVLEALSDPYRRQLLLALIEHNPQDDSDPDPLNIHPDGEDALSKLNIFMGHLPKLDEMGIIEWNEAENEIIKGPDWGEFEPLLQLIAENKDELPEEWFSESETE